MKLLALCVLGAVFALLLREEKQVLAIFVIFALVLAAIPLLWEALVEVFSFFQRLITLSGLSEKVFSPMLSGSDSENEPPEISSERFSPLR